MNFLKEAGKMMVTLTIIATAIYILVEHTKDWPSIIVLAIFLAMWLQLVYHLFKRVNVSSKGVTFDGETNDKDGSGDLIRELQDEVSKLKESNKKLSDRIDKTNDRISKLHPAPKKETFDAMLGVQLYVDDISVDNTTYSGMVKGSPYDSFCEQVSFAKRSNVNLKDSPNYQKILGVFQSVICNHLTDQLTSLYDNNVNSFKDTIKQALKQYPYSKKTLLAVRDDLVEDYGKRSQCTLLFDEVTNKLDRMY